MNDTVSTGLELTIFMSNIAPAGNFYLIYLVCRFPTNTHLRIIIAIYFPLLLLSRSKDGCNGAESVRQWNVLFIVLFCSTTWLSSKYVMSTG